MLKLKKLLSLIAVLCVVSAVFCACGKMSADREYGYNDLPDEQQAVIDGVMNSFDNWKSTFDSGRDIPCIKVNFFVEEDKLIFCTYYSDDTPTANNFGTTQTGFSCFYEVDKSNGSMTAHKYTYLDNVNKKIANSKSAFGADFNIEDQQGKQKDILANSFYKALNSEK